MANITASANERELTIFNKEYEKQKGREPKFPGHLAIIIAKTPQVNSDNDRLF